jgi:hypothetical protein
MADSSKHRGWKWDGPNDQLEIWHDGLKILSFTATATDAPVMLPAVDNNLSLGGATCELKDINVDGTANIDTLAADAATIGATTFSDHITMTTAKNVQTATGNNKEFSLAAGSATGTAFSDVISVTSATVLANRELGFFGSTNCVAQQAHIADSTGGATTVTAILTALRNYGLLATA